MQTNQQLAQFLFLLVALFAVGCGVNPGAHPAELTPTAAPITPSTIQPQPLPTSQPSATNPPPSPTGSPQPPQVDIPEDKLIASLICVSDDSRQEMQIKSYQGEQDHVQYHVFECGTYVTQWDFAYTLLEILRYSSHADAEAAFFKKPGTLGDDHGYVVITSEDVLSHYWYYLGEQHVVQLEREQPFANHFSVYIDIGFDLELFANALGFLRSPAATLTPP